jgi:CheW-like domain
MVELLADGDTVETVQLERFILALLEPLTVVFSSDLVAEIILLERTQILALPFYPSPVLGCAHHNGQVIPLVQLSKILRLPPKPLLEILTVVRLSGAASPLGGVGLVMDSMLGSKTRDQLPQDLFESSQPLKSVMWLFQPSIFEANLWQPNRWQVSSTALPHPTAGLPELERST